MNETIKVLTTRRSVRKFKSDPVPEKVLDEILTAGMYAPTGMGQQSPIIIVITDPEVRAEVSELNAEIAGMSGDPFYGAPVILLVAAKKRPTDVYDGTCVISNLMNAAWSLGVGSCWIHRAKEELEGEWGKHRGRICRRRTRRTRLSRRRDRRAKAAQERLGLPHLISGRT